MQLRIGTRTLDRILVVDDDVNARQGYGYPIEDLGLTPIFQKKPLGELKIFMSGLRRKADAVFSDYRLRIQSGYARFDGDVLVAECYRKGIPAILCTTYTDVDSHLNRENLRYIPVLLRTNDPPPEVIRDGYAKCIDELKGNFLPSRKAWRTLIRVYDVDTSQHECHVVIPGRNLEEKITLRLNDLPSNIKDQVTPDKRFHAQVNLGAESFRELYFTNWEND